MTLSRLQKQKTAMKPTIRIESSSERFILCTQNFLPSMMKKHSQNYTQIHFWYYYDGETVEKCVKLPTVEMLMNLQQHKKKTVYLTNLDIGCSDV